ncbi:MAG: 30S ribosomal protein S16 [Planctomycetota bacterium]
MSVRLRLKRTGRNNQPFFRIAAFHRNTRRDGPPVEDLGWYDPLVKEREKSFRIDEERARYWLSVGAIPSHTVRSMLKLRGIKK